MEVINMITTDDKNPVYNTDLGLEKTILYESEKANDFNNMRRFLTCLGFKIKKIVLTDSGSMKLVAIIRKKKLCKCLLTKKNIPDNDRVYPRCNTDPEFCEFHINGMCKCCNDHDFCLYQDTPKHISIIKYMVKRYNNYDREHCDTCSTYYEDTILGRIFSGEYNHLNNESRNVPNYYRHYGR